MGGGGRRRVSVASAALVAAVAVLVVRADRVGAPTGADREALAEVLDRADGTTIAELVFVSAGRNDLVADDGRWSRLVAGGGTDLAAVLDRSHGGFGVTRAPDVVAPPADPSSPIRDLPPPATLRDRAADSEAMVEPWIAGRPVDPEVLSALGRWSWPLLAVDLRTDDDRRRAARVLRRAGESPAERRAVAEAVLLARSYRLILSPVHAAAALAAWRADLSALVGGSDELFDDDVELPGPVALGVASTWGQAYRKGAPEVHRVLLHADTAAPVSGRSLLTISGFVAAVSDPAVDPDPDDDVDVAYEGELAVAALARQETDLDALAGALLASDDPAIAAVADDARYLASV